MTRRTGADDRERPAWRHILLATVSFALCFAAWGLISALAPRLRQQLGLSPMQTGLLVAAPVLLGALGRIPLGILADRFGARRVFAALMASVVLVALCVPCARTWPSLLAVALLLGLAGSSFAVGAGYASRWSPATRQGAALGVYGVGNIGQSVAVFLAPVVAGDAGLPVVFYGMAVILACWVGCWLVLARDAPQVSAPGSIAAMAALLLRARLSWVLALFYFLTFGGFVALGLYLPTLLQDLFRLAPADAGLRTAGFVLLATTARPVGGWLSDRYGGERVLVVVFLGIVPCALLLAGSTMVPFTFGALGCAALLGLGNGAVFKLVPQLFPAETGTVSGLVGALGGLGGFFPPLLLSACQQRFSVHWPAFALLALTALALAALARQLFGSRLRRGGVGGSPFPPDTP